MKTNQMELTCSLSFLLFFFFINACYSLRCSSDQSLALLTFKRSLFWSNKTSYVDLVCIKTLGDLYQPLKLNWSVSTDCCSWNGITCNHTTGDVIYIDLSCGKLQGTINSNSTLFNLPYIRILNLANNYLEGNINQQSFAKLKSLSTLRLSYNDFKGKWDLGELLSCLPNLNILSLSNSGLSIMTNKPAIYVNPNLSILGLGSCSLTVFPRYLRALEHLQDLDISNNKITHLPELEFYELYVLTIASNMIEGQFPSCICNMSNLVTMDISSNRFGGVIPQCLGNLSSTLTLLNAKSNMFFGAFPTTILNMSKLNFLDLSDNNFSGMIPASIGRLKSLENLNLSHNSFNGPIPQTIGNLVAMRSLDISRNKLTGEIPQNMNDLTSLQFINVSENQLAGNIPQGGVIEMFDSDSFEGNSELSGDPLPKCEQIDKEKKKFTSTLAWQICNPLGIIVLGCLVFLVQINWRAIFEATIYKIYKQD